MPDFPPVHIESITPRDDGTFGVVFVGANFDLNFTRASLEAMGVPIRVRAPGDGYLYYTYSDTDIPMERPVAIVGMPIKPEGLTTRPEHPFPVYPPIVERQRRYHSIWHGNNGIDGLDDFAAAHFEAWRRVHGTPEDQPRCAYQRSTQRVLVGLGQNNPTISVDLGSWLVFELGACLFTVERDAVYAARFIEQAP